MGEWNIVHSNVPTRDLQESGATGNKMMLQYRSIRDDARIERGVLMNGEAIVLAIVRRDAAEGIALVLIVKSPLFVAGMQSVLRGIDPDLEQMDGRVRAVELAVNDSRAGGHPLDVTGGNNSLVAHRIFMLNGTRENIGNDLHVAVRVHAESSSGGDAVLIDNSKRPKMNMRWIVIIGKRKSMVGIEPSMIEMAAFGGGSFGEHI